MQQFGGINQQGLSLFGNAQSPEGGAPGFGSRMFDSDGDGRMDLFLLDFDNDGTVDKVVRGVDSNGDGVNDTFISYNDDGSVESIGRMNPATGEMETIYEEPGIIEEILSALGLLDLESPEQALFTSFNDPYIMTTYGTFGEEVPIEPMDSLVVEPGDIIESDSAPSLEAEGATVVDTPEPVTETASSDSSVLRKRLQEKNSKPRSRSLKERSHPKQRPPQKSRKYEIAGARQILLPHGRVWIATETIWPMTRFLSPRSVMTTSPTLTGTGCQRTLRPIWTMMVEWIRSTQQVRAPQQTKWMLLRSYHRTLNIWQTSPVRMTGWSEVSAEVADSAPTADIGSDVDSGSVTAEPYDAPDSSSSVDTSPDSGVDAGASTTVEYI